MSYAVGYFSGNEDGVHRLEGQVVTEMQDVMVTILGVQSTPHFTRVEIHADNGTSSSLSLPLFHNATLPESATAVSPNFVTVFVMGFDGPRSITVPDIPLKPLAGPQE